jgi:DNA-binding PadR family transcriptional regulator
LFNHHNHRDHGHRGHRDFAHPRGGRFGSLMHEGMRRRRHGGEARLFEQGDLRWVILSLIAEKDSHGYELIKALEERTGGAYSPSPGVIYPTLTLLEELGYVVEAASSGAKKAFAITDEGRAALEQNQASVKAIFDRMTAFAERAGGGPSPQVVRAMQNLRLALRLKLEAGRMTEEQAASVAKALDEAAVAIERS